MAIIYDNSGVKARPHNIVARAHRIDRVYAFWVVLEGGAWTLPFTVSLPDGREAIALFTSEEEARMFPEAAQVLASHWEEITNLLQERKAQILAS